MLLQVDRLQSDRLARRAALALLALLALFVLACACTSGAPRQSAGSTESARTSAAAAERTIAIVGATVLPMTDARELPRHTVIVRGDRIVAVGPEAEVAMPADVTRIDGRGRFLLPGLVDMHVHLDGPGPERDLPLYLANGITTIRNMRGTPAHVAMRDRIARGELVGPTLYTAGPYPDRVPASMDVDGIVASQQLAGYDFLKVHDRDFPRERYLQLAERARARRMPLLGHVPTAVGVAGAVQAGYRTFEHAEDLMQTFFDMQLDSTRFPALVATLRGRTVPGARVCVVPTLVVFGYVLRHVEEFPDLARLQARPELRFVRPELRDAWHPDRNGYVQRGRGREADMPRIAQRTREQFAFLQAMTRALHAGGIPLAAGSDAGVAHTLAGYSLVEELALLQASGLSTHEVLHSATRGAAACMDKGEEFGSVSVGQRADLLLLDRDPRLDLSAVADLSGLVLRGRWLPREMLRRMLEAAPSGD